MKKLILLLMLGVMLFAAASETKPLTAGFMECAGSVQESSGGISVPIASSKKMV